ncbi:MAG: hypothetical protein J7M15_01865 [Anaerolineae bacterium]|nr:hypothetical protein [Anaerolineae bacterium]
MRADKYLLLNWKRILLIIGAWVLAVILHNLIYGLFQSYFDVSGGDEPFFFILAVIVIPLYALVALVYTIIRLLTRRS